MNVYPHGSCALGFRAQLGGSGRWLSVEAVRCGTLEVTHPRGRQVVLLCGLLHRLLRVLKTRRLASPRASDSGESAGQKQFFYDPALEVNVTE